MPSPSCRCAGVCVGVSVCVCPYVVLGQLSFVWLAVMPTWHANFSQVWLVKPKSDGCRIWKLGRSIVIINISMIMILIIICTHTHTRYLACPGLASLGLRPRQGQDDDNYNGNFVALVWLVIYSGLFAWCAAHSHTQTRTHPKTQTHTHTIPYSQFALLILCCSWCEVLVYTPRAKFVNLPCQRVLAMLPCGALYTCSKFMT